MAAGLELLCMHGEVQLARSRGDGAAVGELCQAGNVTRCSRKGDCVDVTCRRPRQEVGDHACGHARRCVEERYLSRLHAIFAEKEGLWSLASRVCW